MPSPSRTGNSSRWKRWNVFRLLQGCVGRRNGSTNETERRDTAQRPDEADAKSSDEKPVHVQEQAVLPVTAGKNASEESTATACCSDRITEQTSAAGQSGTAVKPHGDCVHKRRLAELRVEVQRLMTVTRAAEARLGRIVVGLHRAQEAKAGKCPVAEAEDAKNESFRDEILSALKASEARQRRSQAWLVELQSGVKLQSTIEHLIRPDRR